MQSEFPQSLPTGEPESELDALLRYAPGLRALAVRLVGADDADDLLQETWIRALRRPPTTDRPVWPWLVRVLRNGAFNMRRARRARQVHEAEAAVYRGANDGAAGEDGGSLAELEAAALLLRAVEALPEPQRAVVTGCYLVGQTSAQVGDALALPPSTVRWHLRSAVGSLRVRLRVADQGRDPSGWVAGLLPLLRWPAAGPVPEPAPAASPSGKLSRTGAAAARVGGAALGLTWPRWVGVGGLGAALLAAVGLSGSGGSAPELEPSAGPLDDAIRVGAAPADLAAPLNLRAALGDLPRTSEGESEPPRQSALVSEQRVRAVLRDGAGLPWSGAVLRLERAPTLAKQLSRAALPTELVAEAFADAAGAATLSLPWDAFGAEADLYRLVIRAPGAATVTTHLPGYVGVDLDLGALTLEPEVTVAGVVVDAAGLPVPGALVTAVPAIAAPLAVSALADELDAPLDLLGTRAVADYAGRFELRGLPPRATRFDAAAPDGRRAERSVALAELLGGAPVQLELSSAPLTIERLRLSVRTPSGEAVPGARVAVRRGRLRARELDADAQGTLDEVLAHFEGDPREPVTLHAWDPQGELALGTLEGVVLDGVPRTLTLGPAVPLVVDVTGAGGPPIDGFTWRLVLEGGRLARAGRVAEGSRAVLPRPNGQATLAVAALGYEPALVPIGAGGALAVELQPEAVLVGSVTAEGGPVAGARVVVALPRSPRLVVSDTTRLRRELGPRVVFTDADGRFEVPRPAGGEVTVTVTRADLAPAVVRLGRGRGEGPLEVRMAAGGTLLGELRLPSGSTVTTGQGDLMVVAEHPDGTSRVVPLSAGRLPMLLEYGVQALGSGPWRVAAWVVDPVSGVRLEQVSEPVEVALTSGHAGVLRMVALR